MKKLLIFLALSIVPAGLLAAEEPAVNVTTAAAQANVDDEIGSLQGGDVPSRLSAVKKLETVRDNKAFRALIAALKSEKNPLMRSRIAEAIGKSDNPGTTAALIDIVENEKDQNVRGTAIRVLGYKHSSEAAEALLVVFGNENEPDGARVTAANALKMQEPSGKIFDALVKGAKSKSQSVRETSVNTLADAYGPQYKGKTGDELKKLEDSTDKKVRDTAKERLDKLENKPVKNGNKKQ
jgi:HEAT repeat protein